MHSYQLIYKELNSFANHDQSKKNKIDEWGIIFLPVFLSMVLYEHIMDKTAYIKCAHQPEWDKECGLFSH